MVVRRKVSAAYNSLVSELGQLSRLDDLNHARYYPGPGRPGIGRLSSRQMYLLTESILARAFSKYEQFIEQVFILYCMGKPTMGGNVVGSYLTPSDFHHAKQMLKSGMTFLEWNDADKVIQRCEIYLYEDSPVYIALTTHGSKIRNIRRVRNAIAHSSGEAETQYLKTVRDELGTLPLAIPRPGEFLLMRDRRARPRQHILKSYLSSLKVVAQVAAD